MESTRLQSPTDKTSDSWGEPSIEAVKRLNKLAAEALRDSKAGKLKSYNSVDEFMKDIV